ncbi:hypothetical protein OJAV_G00220420 [Oryzias javanicus]|uniref:Uncharacterized protein n=1 Tax=Oryzias javanicus TaxID=123683 RepID=A0A3S2MCX4_ORYJA|nr:hypothetical protein OJAV_G00220420 [Oryzias javanicus]
MMMVAGACIIPTPGRERLLLVPNIPVSSIKAQEPRLSPTFQRIPGKDGSGTPSGSHVLPSVAAITSSAFSRGQSGRGFEQM